VNVKEVPKDVIKIIFCYICEENALPYALQLRAVCRAWRELVDTSAELWRRADFSYPSCNPRDSDLQLLFRIDAWKHILELSLRECGKLSDASLSTVVGACSRLCLLDLSETSCFSEPAISEAAAQMPRLTTLRLSRLVTKPQRKGAVDSALQAVGRSALPDSLRHLEAELCPHLTNRGLRAIVNAGRGASPFRCMHGLRTLALTASGSLMGRISLPLDGLQRCCPNLERLLVNGLGGAYGWEPGAPSALRKPGRGLPRLVVAEVAACVTVRTAGTELGTSYVTDDVLRFLLHASRGLEELDIGGCRAGPEGIRGIPEGAPLRRVSVARGAAACDEALELLVQCSWRTLEALDAGGAGHAITDESLGDLACCPSLRHIDISGSAVTDRGLRELAEQRSCLERSALRSIDIKSCRGVTREARKAAAIGPESLWEHLKEDRGPD